MAGFDAGLGSIGGRAFFGAGSIMLPPNAIHLSRRERQIMDVVYAQGRATVAQILAGIADPPSYSAVRALVRILERKGHLKHSREGVRYVYQPTRSRRRAGRSALQRVLRTFYGGDVGLTVAALLDVSDAQLSHQELDRIAALIEQARAEGR